MKTIAEMTDAELKALAQSAGNALSEQAEMMATTPEDTRAYVAMAESRPGLLSFKAAIDREIVRRWA